MIRKYYKLTDYSQYESGKCNNGGSYSFTEELVYIPAIMKYVLLHNTSSDFEYCRYCGNFGHSEEQCQPQELSIMAAMKMAKEWYNHSLNDSKLEYSYGETI